MSERAETMKNPCITGWRLTQPGAVYSGLISEDQYGNVYYQPANRETVIVRLSTDGRGYTDWTLAGCYEWVKQQAVRE